MNAWKVILISAGVSVLVVFGGDFGRNRLDGLVERMGENENQDFDRLQRIIKIESDCNFILDFVGKDIIPSGWYTLMPTPKERTVKYRLEAIESRLDALEKGASK